MAESYAAKNRIEPLSFKGNLFDFVEQMDYPNGGFTRFYEYEDTAVAVDYDICKCTKKEDVFSYTLITDKQNQYVKEHLKFLPSNGSGFGI